MLFTTKMKARLTHLGLSEGKQPIHEEMVFDLHDEKDRQETSPEARSVLKQLFWNDAEVFRGPW